MTDNSRPPVPCVQILRLPQVCKATGLGRSMIYQLESERRFSCRVRIGARAVGWVEAEVQGWLAGRIERHRASGPCIAAPIFPARGGPRRGANSPTPRKALNKQPADLQQVLFDADRLPEQARK